MHGYYIVLSRSPEWQGVGYAVCHISEADAAHVGTVVEAVNERRDVFLSGLHSVSTNWLGARILALPISELSDTAKARFGMALADVVEWERSAGDLARQPNAVTEIILGVRKAVGQCLKALRGEVVEMVPSISKAATEAEAVPVVPAVKWPKTRRGLQTLAATNTKDYQIIAGIKENKSYRTIAEECKVGKTTVGRVAKAYGLTGHAPDPVPLDGTLQENLTIRGKPGKHGSR